MRRQFGRLDFDQIRFDVLDNLVARIPREKIDNVRIDFGGCGKGPTLGFFPAQNFGDLIGQLPINATIVFAGKSLSFSNGIHVPSAHPSIAYRESAGLIRHLVHQSTVGVGDIECLHKLQTRTAGGRFINSVCF